MILSLSYVIRNEFDSPDSLHHEAEVVSAEGAGEEIAYCALFFFSWILLTFY